MCCLCGTKSDVWDKLRPGSLPKITCLGEKNGMNKEEMWLAGNVPDIFKLMS